MSDAGPDTAAPRRRGRWFPAVLALAALLAIGLVWGAGADLTHPASKSLSGSDVSAQLAASIQAARSLRSPPVVTCPGHEPLATEFRFRCHLDDGTPIDVVETDNRGHLRWSLPPG